MEEQIKKIYSQMKRLTAEAIFMGLSCIIMFTIFVSIFEGNPLPNVVEDGWILEKPHLWIWVAIMSVILERLWLGKRVKNIYHPFISLLEDKCDPVALRWGTQYAIGYGREHNESKSAIYYFEHQHIMALNALGEFSEAIHYLQHSWVSENQNKIRDRWLMVARLNEASERGHVGLYMRIWNELPPAMKKNIEVQAQMLQLQGKYEDALKMFQMIRGKKLFTIVSQQAGIAECLVKMGRGEDAREYLEFVLQNANTTVYKQNAIRDLERLEDRCNIE